MFLVRLLLGLIKGILIGGLLGWGLAALGMGVPHAAIAYVGAAICGMLIATVAGKPIWAKDARIEVGLKAGAGAVLGALLMLAVRSFLDFGLPLDPSILPGVGAQQSATLANFSVTSLALVTAVLGGFFDADHNPNAEENGDDGAKGGGSKRKRIDAGSALPDVDDIDIGEEAEERRAQR